jgi:Flp pilus assembly protein TadD
MPPSALRLLVFPLDLSADYSPDVIVPAAGWTPSVIFGFLLLVATVVFALRLLLPSDGSRPGALRLLQPSHGSRPGALRLLLPADGSRPGSFAAAWLLVAVVPVSNLLVPIGVVLAERTLYVPSFAIAILTAAVAARIVAAASDAQPGAGHVATRAAVAAAIVLLLLGVRTVTRNPDWRDTPAYWNALVRDHPESYRAQWGAAAHMIANGEPEQGLRYMESAAETWNDDPHLLAQLGGLYIERGQPARALEVLQRAWSLGHEDGPMPLYLGMAAIGTGQFDNAMAWAGLARSSENQAERAAAEALRAQALDGLGRPGEAASAWMAAIEASPGRSFTYWMMLARAHGRAGHAARATAAADTARLLAPDEEAVLRVDRLKAVIATDCWKDSGRANGPDRCADPLEDWILVTPSRAITIEQRSSSP